MLTVRLGSVFGVPRLFGLRLTPTPDGKKLGLFKYKGRSMAMDVPCCSLSCSFSTGAFLSWHKPADIQGTQFPNALASQNN